MDETPNQPFQSNVETIETVRPTRWRMIAATATGSFALLGVAVGVGYAAAGPSAGASAAGTTTTTAPAQPPKQDFKQHEAERLNKLLQPLVDKGTITAAQRDAVVAALAADGPKGGGGRGGHGGPGGMIRGAMGLLGADADAAAKAIGISTDDLKKAVLGGQSLAAIAKAHNVDPQKVIDALVAATKAQLAQHPRPNGATGPTDAQITERITNLVNGTLPKMPSFAGPGGPGGRHGGPGGPGQWGSPDGAAPAAPATPPTTAAPAPTTTVPAVTTTEPATTTTTP